MREWVDILEMIRLWKVWGRNWGPTESFEWRYISLKVMF